MKERAASSTGSAGLALYAPCPRLLRSRRFIACQPHHPATWNCPTQVPRPGPGFGRAEVVLTIDNADGALPIEYSEVTISRTLFRNGSSEYAINGEQCRLLDVQELLSDSGLGREMHVIVGQGQLDQVLHASPEERRGFIEEAAGIRKYRRRKEKAGPQARGARTEPGAPRRCRVRGAAPAQAAGAAGGSRP